MNAPEIEVIREAIEADGEKTRELIVNVEIARGGHPADEADQVLEEDESRSTQ